MPLVFLGWLFLVTLAVAWGMLPGEIGIGGFLLFLLSTGPFGLGALHPPEPVRSGLEGLDQLGTPLQFAACSFLGYLFYFVTLPWLWRLVARRVRLPRATHPQSFVFLANGSHGPLVFGPNRR
jgi:hypothetical protein